MRAIQRPTDIRNSMWRVFGDEFDSFEHGQVGTMGTDAIAASIASDAAPTRH